MASTKRTSILFCSLVGAAAELDAAGCAAGAPPSDDEVSMLQFQYSPSQDDWVLHTNLNCYPGHGAAEQSSPEDVDGYPSCKAKFADWDGVVMDNALQKTCWGIRGVDVSQCIAEDAYSTYLAPSSATPAPDYCSARCTFATEHQDCGGECGLCDGEICIRGNPVPTQPPPVDYCSARCTFATEHQDCGGECGLCDGEICIRGNPVPTQEPAPINPSWTPYPGYNCYVGAGATVSQGPETENMHGVEDCQARFSAPEWAGVVLNNDGEDTCFGIKGVDLDQCIQDSPYSTYLK